MANMSSNELVIIYIIYAILCLKLHKEEEDLTMEGREFQRERKEGMKEYRKNEVRE